MWARAHWDRQVTELEAEHKTVLQRLRQNLQAQRDPLDRMTTRNRAKPAGIRDELRRGYEGEFENVRHHRRGELLRALDAISGEETRM
jgi:hypothetical protein